MSFAFLGWLDVYELSCSLRQRIGFFSPKAGPVRTLQIRGPGPEGDPDDDAAFSWARNRDKWPELMNILGQLERIGAATGGIEWGRISLELLMPSGIVPLAADASGYAERYARAHLALRTNPFAALLCGPAARGVAAGEAVMLLPLRPPKPPMPVGAVNMGDTPRVHLVVDFRRKDAEP